MAALIPEWQSCVAATQTVWPRKSNVFTNWPSSKLANICSLQKNYVSGHPEKPLPVFSSTRRTTGLCSATGSAFLLRGGFLPLPPLPWPPSCCLFYPLYLWNPGTPLNPILNVTSSRKSSLFKGEDDLPISGATACDSCIPCFTNYYSHFYLPSPRMLKRTQVHQEVGHALYILTSST